MPSASVFFLHLGETPAHVTSAAAINDDSFEHVEVNTQWSVDLEPGVGGQEQVKITAPLAGTKLVSDPDTVGQLIRS